MKLGELHHFMVAGTAAAALAAAFPAMAEGDQPRARSEAQQSERQMQYGANRQGQEQVRQVQQALKDAGHDPGPMDGVMGPQTQNAIRDFQQEKGLQATGRLDRQTLAALNIDESASSGRSASTGASAPPNRSGSASEGSFAGSQAHASCDGLTGKARTDCLESRSTPSVTSGGSEVTDQPRR